jgi:RNA-directed DNA polymerase
VQHDRQRRVLALRLAAAFLNAPWSLDGLAEEGASWLGGWPTWLDALAMHLTATFPTRPELFALAARIETFFAEHRIRDLQPALALPAPPAAEQRRWPVARIGATGELAEILELSAGQLAWLADVRSLERRAPNEKLRNYRYESRPRPNGLPRVIEIPKARLKEIQRWVLREILDRIPVHSTAHGFTRARSVVTHAALHTASEDVLQFDLEDFFASVTAGRVFGIFRTAGYSREVAHTLTGLCTNVIPLEVWAALPRNTDPRLVSPRFWLGRRLAAPHLPQGAPTSPSLANLAAYRLDLRLSRLAESLGLKYSRYADDLAFSGRIRREVSLVELVARIVRGEGFALNLRKTRRQAAATRQSVCGVVVNAHPNVVRREYDRLKATLHNAARHGPSSQNRAGARDFRAHLQGRIAWVASINPERGEKLRGKFAAIDWSEER